MFKIGSKVNVFVNDFLLSPFCTIVDFDYKRELIEVENSAGRKFLVMFNEVEAV